MAIFIDMLPRQLFRVCVNLQVYTGWLSSSSWSKGLSGLSLDINTNELVGCFHNDKMNVTTGKTEPNKISCLRKENRFSVSPTLFLVEHKAVNPIKCGNHTLSSVLAVLNTIINDFLRLFFRSLGYQLWRIVEALSRTFSDPPLT